MTSHVEFGPFSTGEISARASRVAFIQFNEDFYWSITGDGFAIGSTDKAYATPDELTTIFDTGASHIFIPNSLFDVYLNRVIKEAGGAKFHIRNGQIYTDCRDTFPTLYFLFDGYWLEVIPESYLVDVSTFGDGSLCSLLFMKNTEDYWIMG